MLLVCGRSRQRKQQSRLPQWKKRTAEDHIDHADYPGREYLCFWEGYEVDECSYGPTKQFAFDAGEMELAGPGKKIIIDYKGSLRQCSVLAVLSYTSVKVSWARPPAGESKEFTFDLIQMTESINEWTIHGYDEGCE